MSLSKTEGNNKDIKMDNPYNSTYFEKKWTPQKLSPTQSTVKRYPASQKAIDEGRLVKLNCIITGVSNTSCIKWLNPRRTGCFPKISPYNPIVNNAS